MIGSAGVVWNDTGLCNSEAKKGRSVSKRHPQDTWQRDALPGIAGALAHLVSARSKVKLDKRIP